jgi:hypothetical protein
VKEEGGNCLKHTGIPDTMKRSEKVKGKEAAALRRKKSKMYGIGIAAGIIVIAVIIGFFLLSP